MRGFHNSFFDPQTLALIEKAFDEAWLTLTSVGNKTVKPDELARSVLRVAMEGERMAEALAGYQGPITKCPPGSGRAKRPSQPS